MYYLLQSSIAHVGPRWYMVRVQRVELWSQPWEGHIIAVIRYPQKHLEPPAGIEPATYALRKRRSTS